MRIVLSNASAKWGGVHQVTDQLATGLVARGHDIMILSRPGSVLDQRLRSRFDVRAVARGMDFSPRAIHRITAVLRSFRPDVVVALMDKDLRLTGIAARLLGIPVVARRANDQPIGRGPYYRFLYRGIPKLHIANSNATKHTMVESTGWLPPESIQVIYNGINVDAISATVPAVLPVPAGAIVVGLIGRLEVRKGVREMLAAWPAVSEACPDAHLVMIGRGPLEPEVRERVATLQRAHFLGYRDDIPAVLHATDIVAVPSHWEGFGLIAAEAMAAGKPVVASNASSLPELIRDGQEGLLVPPADSAALAAALTRLCTDESLRTALGARAHARARTTFSLGRMIDQYETALTEMARSQ